MSISQWNSFTDYVVGNQVQYLSSTVYGCIANNRNEYPPNTLYWNDLTPPVGSGLVSLNSLTSANNNGNLLLSSSTGDVTFTTNPTTGAINVAVNGLGGGVTTINSLDGSLNVTSVSGSVMEILTISPSTISVGLKSGVSGTYVENTGGSDTVTLAAACSPSSVINVTYIHAGGGGGSQYIKTLVPATGNFTLTMNTNIDVGDRINWFVASATV